MGDAWPGHVALSLLVAAFAFGQDNVKSQVVSEDHSCRDAVSRTARACGMRTTAPCSQFPVGRG
jgi:hypothetical protein